MVFVMMFDSSCLFATIRIEVFFISIFRTFSAQGFSCKPVIVVLEGEAGN